MHYHVRSEEGLPAARPQRPRPTGFLLRPGAAGGASEPGTAGDELSVQRMSQVRNANVRYKHLPKRRISRNHDESRRINKTITYSTFQLVVGHEADAFAPHHLAMALRSLPGRCSNGSDQDALPDRTHRASPPRVGAPRGPRSPLAACRAD